MWLGLSAYSLIIFNAFCLMFVYLHFIMLWKIHVIQLTCEERHEKIIPLYFDALKLPPDDYLFFTLFFTLFFA